MDYLAKQNPHARDNHILFDEPTHTYTIDGDSNYVSVTTLNGRHFKKFDSDAIITCMMKSPRWPQSKYYGQSREEIKTGWDKNRDEAASAGTKMHYDIECYFNKVSVINDSIEYNFFIDYQKDNPFTPYRTEWTVWDKELKLAGSIDMVYENPDGTLMIYDWKRSKEIVKNKRFAEFSTVSYLGHIPDTNYWHYALQLNTYKAIVEKNYGKKVTKMCLVCLHPTQKSYLLYDVPDLSTELALIFAARKNELDK
jgi:hypothetical protein